MDALLWLRQVIETGEPARIEQAKQAAGQITTPLDELEKRYGKWLVAGAGHMFAGLGSIGFADLDWLAKRAITRRANEAEAAGRFGDALWDDTQSEAFRLEALRGSADQHPTPQRHALADPPRVKVLPAPPTLDGSDEARAFTTYGRRWAVVVVLCLAGSPCPVGAGLSIAAAREQPPQTSPWKMGDPA